MTGEGERGLAADLGTRAAGLKDMGVGGVTTIAANVVGLWAALANVAYAIYVLLLFDLAMVAVCGYVATARQTAGGEAAEGEARPHRWDRRARSIARLGLLVLVPCTAFILYQLAPNRLTGWHEVHGSLCAGPREAPLSAAIVDAVDGTGASVAFQEAEADDYGFFFIDLRPWARKPRQLIVTAKQCGTVRVDIGRPARERSSCGAVPQGAIPLRDQGPVWRLPCPGAGSGE